MQSASTYTLFMSFYLLFNIVIKELRNTINNSEFVKIILVFFKYIICYSFSFIVIDNQFFFSLKLINTLRDVYNRKKIKYFINII